MSSRELIDCENAVNGRKQPISKEFRGYKGKIFNISSSKLETEISQENEFAKETNYGGSNWAEDFFYMYYKNNGYKVIDLDPKQTVKIREKIATKLNADNIKNLRYSGDNIWNYTPEKGTPDLLVIKDEEIFFVEVKTGGGGLRKEQLEWMISKTSFTTKLAFVDVVEE